MAARNNSIVHKHSTVTVQYTVLYCYSIAPQCTALLFGQIQNFWRKSLEKSMEIQGNPGKPWKSREIRENHGNPGMSKKGLIIRVPFVLVLFKHFSPGQMNGLQQTTDIWRCRATERLIINSPDVPLWPDLKMGFILMFWRNSSVCVLTQNLPVPVVSASGVWTQSLRLQQLTLVYCACA